MENRDTKLKKLRGRAVGGPVIMCDLGSCPASLPSSGLCLDQLWETDGDLKRTDSKVEGRRLSYGFVLVVTRR